MFEYKGGERRENAVRSFVERRLRFESVAETARLGQELIELFVIHASIDEFFSAENAVGVLVHHSKDIQGTFIGFDLSFMLISVIANQFVDRLEDVSVQLITLVDAGLWSTLTLMMRRISVSSIDPSPLQSYIRKAMSSFLSGVP